MSFDESDDFIIGIQVKRLYYKRWCFWKLAELVSKTYVRGATMLDSDEDDDQTGDEVAEEDITETDPEMTGMTLKAEHDVAKDEISWVIPSS